MENESNIPEADGGEVVQREVSIPFPESFVYANCAAFSIGQMEIRISFAEAMQTGNAVAKAGIVLPPEAAAVIAMVLFDQVRKFEQNFGEIRHPMWKAMKAGSAKLASPYAEPKTVKLPETQVEE